MVLSTDVNNNRLRGSNKNVLLINVLMIMSMCINRCIIVRSKNTVKHENLTERTCNLKYRPNYYRNKSIPLKCNWTHPCSGIDLCSIPEEDPDNVSLVGSGRKVEGGLTPNCGLVWAGLKSIVKTILISFLSFDRANIFVER